MSTTVSYKGQTLATVSNQTKTLLTEGKYLEDDITLEDVSGGGAVLGTKNITANGTYEAEDDSLDGYSEVTVAVPASAVDSGTKSITANGNNQDVVGYAAVNVNVPNTYSAGDEGKVVSNGALVAQTSDTVTANDTYDTTLINSLTVNVSGGGVQNIEKGSFTLAAGFELQNTPAIFTPIHLSFKPDFFWMGMERTSWDDISSPSGGVYGLFLIDKDFMPPLRISSNVSTDALTNDYISFLTVNTIASTDVTSNGTAINGFTLLGTSYDNRFYFDNDGYLYVGRYSSSAAYIKQGTFNYIAGKFS